MPDQNPEVQKMQLHADRKVLVLVRSREVAWIPSPLKGVDRRMLERDGDEVARATTIVRYAPESYFSPHTHTGGEEFLVLEGVFSDEHGDFPAGMYVRNPVGSKHRPHSADGCTILVKLWQMPTEDQDWVRVNTNDIGAYHAHTDGLSVLPLHATSFETVEIWHMAAGASIREQTFPGGLELFVVEGELDTPSGPISSGDWLRLPVGSCFKATSNKGGKVFVKHGHLARDLPGPSNPND